jgi:hypothetical protein
MKTALAIVPLSIAGLSALTAALLIINFLVWPRDDFDKSTKIDGAVTSAIVGFIISAAMIGIAYGIATSR